MNSLEIAKQHLIHGNGILLIVLPQTTYVIRELIRQLYEDFPDARCDLARGEMSTCDAKVMFKNMNLSRCSITGLRLSAVVVDELVSLEECMKEEILSRIVVPRGKPHHL